MKRNIIVNNRQIDIKLRGRSSNLELYRIITMIMIVAHHYVVNSGLMDLVYADPMSGSSIFLLLFGAWGKTGINCFVLITGYFMCTSQITIKKFVKLVSELYFYRITIYAIFMVTGYSAFSLKGLIKVLLPFTSIGQNFTGCYLMFYLCIPFLNILIANLNERLHLKLMALLGFIYVVLGTLPIIDVTMNYVSWFVVLYIIASYIRLYPKKIYEHTSFWGIMTAASIVMSILSVLCCNWIGMNLQRQVAYYFLADSNKVLAVVVAVCSFMFFKNLKMNHHPWINRAAASTFGVLLIHANSDTMRQWLWRDMLNNIGMYESSLLAVHAVGSVIGIFVICTAIDFLRIKLIEKVFFKEARSLRKEVKEVKEVK